MQSAFDVLQIQVVLDRLSSFARTQKGKASTLSLRPLEKEDREREYSYLSQAKAISDDLGGFSVPESRDLDEIYSHARKGARLDGGDFSSIYNDLTSLYSLQKAFAGSKEENDLKTHLLSLDPCTPLEQGIKRTFTPEWGIRDSASPDLRRIRYAIAGKKKELNAKMASILEHHKNYLSGQGWTMRNGHYVLPISITFKHQVQGYIQDVSSSGGTAFIEPEALVRYENDIALLEAEEKEEIARILSSLSLLVGRFADTLKEINDELGYLDFLNAKILYGRSLKACLPILEEGKAFDLKAARHPLLDMDKVVPNDFYLPVSRPLLVLSGPNAGGKTVAMKTLGTIAYMYSLALMVPCLEASFPEFQNIYVDIGDSQSIFDSLSTFSGHVQNLASILSLARPGDLLLLDEVGTGTSPREGEALALAILDRLTELSCFGVLSSHFEGIKEKVLSSKKMENASLSFDEETLSPTFHLRLGLPGESYGLEVAHRLGLDDGLLEKAKGYLRQGEEASVSSSLRHLSDLTLQAENLKEELSKKETQVALLEKQLEKEKKQLEKQKEHLEEEVNRKHKEYLEKSKAEVEEILSSLKQDGVKLHQAIEAKGKMEALLEKPEEEGNDFVPVLGDYVEVLEYGLEGIVKRIQGNRVDVVSNEGFLITARLGGLRKAERPKEKKKREPVLNVDALPSKGLPLEVNLIGMRAEEAKIELDHYLDACRLKGYKRVRVIHGLGSGALRRMTHEYLKAHSSFVDKFELGGEYEGGSGATVVYLK